ncbi:MAG: hypothetical protein KY434_00210 [Actinobacteria bacterium]|nr:hypothetical protein [Actinomycetota bacterium]
MRAAGLDVAALTDHASVGGGLLGLTDPGRWTAAPPDGPRWYRSAVGMGERGWRMAASLADAADDPGAFTALRGFEWTHWVLGHVNVWLSQRWTNAVGPSGTGMSAFYRWLARAPEAVLGGGADGLAGFNHPGRSPGRFGGFRCDPRVHDRVVSMEIFNRFDDHLFDGFGRGHDSPLAASLDAGWRVGLLGVTDEHGDDWGVPEGKGRTGLWVTGLSRRAVREALLARRFFATRVGGVRLDASAGGVRMGGLVAHRRGPVDLAVDLAMPPEWWGTRLRLQVLRPGPRVPRVAHVRDVVARGGAEPLRLTVPMDVDDGDWAVLRVADPSAPGDRRGPAGHPASDRALAYASPFWLRPV